MVTLAISCVTTSSLPWFADLTFQVPVQYCSLQHWTLLLPPDTSTTVISALPQPLHSFWSYYQSPPLFPSSIMDTFWPGGLIFQITAFMLLWWRCLCNSMKLWAMLGRVTQDGQVIVESSDKTWSTGGRSGKPPASLPWESHEQYEN